MPVYHEKNATSDKVRASSRETSLNRNSNKNRKREDSIDRKPIISQEKPNTTRKSKPSPPQSKRPQVTGTPKNETKRNAPARGEQSRIASQSERKDRQYKKVEKNSTERTRVSNGRQETKHAVVLPNKSRKVVEERNNSVPSTSTQSDKRKSSRPIPTEGTVSKFSHDRSRTRTLSPSEITVLKKTTKTTEVPLQNYDHAKNDDTHVTKILQGKEDKSSSSEEEEEEEEEEDGNDDSKEERYEYEDDFEDYESDFEEDSGNSSGNEKPQPQNVAELPQEENSEVPLLSQESHSDAKTITSVKKTTYSAVRNSRSASVIESKMDSGSYHMSESSRKVVNEVKVAIENENRNRQKNFQTIDEPIMDSKIDSKSENGILNFAAAGMKRQLEKKNSRMKLRGEEISKMITLDAITYAILEIPAVPYEIFMKSFGKQSTSQAHVQTNEDNCDEEVQTEDINTINKWTQHPFEYSSSVTENGRKIYRFTREERQGVGYDEYLEESPIGVKPLSSDRLNPSIKVAIQRLSLWLEGTSLHNEDSDKEAQTSELSCCERKIILGKNHTQKYQPVASISTASGNSNLIISVTHDSPHESILTVWNIVEPQSPVNILSCCSKVTCVTFGLGSGNLIYAGAADGSLNVWDLREGREYHQVSDKKIGRSPTYSTAVVSDGHASPISSAILLKVVENFAHDFAPSEVCTLDEIGVVIIWSVIQQSRNGSKIACSDLGLAPWGRIRLVKSSSFVINDILSRSEKSLSGERYTSMVRTSAIGNGIYASTSSGRVIHCSTYGILLKPKFFLPNTNARPSAATIIVPHLYDNRFILVGCNDGTIRLHSRRQQQPLINLHWNLTDNFASSSILDLQWLPSRPCLFFALDATSRIHVWNLLISDIYPQYSLPANKNSTRSLAIIGRKKLTQSGQLVVGREDGYVEIHTLKEEFRCKSQEILRKECKMFQRYVAIL